MNPNLLLRPLASLDRLSQRAYMRSAVRALEFSGVFVTGEPLWISPRVYWDLGERGSIRLGDRCVISHFVRLLTHDYSIDRVLEGRDGVSEIEAKLSGPITIGDRAFIGMGATILPGITIGSGAIIGAGAVVTKDVAAETVWAGNPARYVCSSADYLERKLNNAERTQRRM